MKHSIHFYCLGINLCLKCIQKNWIYYSASERFTKNKEIIRKFKETGDTKYIWRNELDKASFQHDMAYGDFKDLARRTASDKVLRSKAFNIAKKPICDGYQRGLASMVYKFFNKKSSGSDIKNQIIQNQQLADQQSASSMLLIFLVNTYRLFLEKIKKRYKYCWCI